MNSLRARLILGFSLVAVVPLALAMLLLSRSIQESVRNQAAERLGATLEMLRDRIRADGERTLEKVEILAKDPALKRLYLVRSGGGPELSEHLAETRFLLGLDFLQVVDTSGAVIADAAAAPDPRGARAAPAAGTDRAAFRFLRGERAPATGLVVERVAGAPVLAMAASAPIRYLNAAVGWVRGGIVLDAARLSQLGRPSGVELILRDAGGRTVAATLGGDEGLAPARGAGAGRAASRPGTYLERGVPIEVGPSPHASITGLAPTAQADRAIATLRATSLTLGLVAVAIAIGLGVLWSLQVSRPVERLADFSQRIARGEWEEPLVLRSVRELETLVEALDLMRRDLRGYRERLVASERQAAWSLMARKVAHEVRNPLTPIAVSVADLKRSYQQQRPDFPAILDQAVRTVGQEVETLRRLLQAFSELGAFPEPRFAPCRVSELLGDLEALYGREVAEGRLRFSRPDADLVFPADRAQLSRALVNLIKNGLEAVEAGGHVEVAASAVPGGPPTSGPALEIEVSDTGPGLSEEQRARLFVPNFTTKAHGSGLGLTIVERIVNDHRGSIAVESGPGRGTCFRIRLSAERGTDACHPS